MTNEADAAYEAPAQRILLWIGGLALVVRLPHLAEAVASVFYGIPILDEAFYDLAARHLLGLGGLDAAGLAELNPGFRPLLYPALVALAYAAGGEHGLFLVLGAQHLLGAATAVLVAVYAARLFRRDATGYAAGALYALAGPPLFYEGRLLITTLFVFLVVAILSVLGHCRPGGRRLPWLLAGCLVGLATQARPNALVLALAFVLVPLWARWRERNHDEGRPRLTGPFVAGPLVAIVALGATLLVAAAVQAPFLGRFAPLPSSGGVNLYLGNERGADGMVPRQDRHATYGDVYRDSVQRFAVEEYRDATGTDDADPRDISRYWIGRTIDEVRHDPGGRGALLLRKAWLLIWPKEVPNNLSYAFVAQEESTILPWLPTRWIWLLPFAAAGLVVAGFGVGTRHAVDATRLRWLVAVGGLHSVTVIAFFVAGRFRIPLWPLASILAAGALVAVADTLRRRGGLRLHRATAAAAIAAAVAVFAVGQVPWPGVELPTPARDFFYRSLAHYEKGELDAARADAEAAVELEPANAAALFQLGTVLLEAEKWQRAAEVLTAASQLLHTEPRPFNNLGIALEKLGHTGDAYAAYRRAIAVEPEFSPARVNAALLLLRAGELDAAEEEIERAEALEDAAGRRTVPRLAARAFLERDRGHAERAAELLEEAMSRDAEATRALEADNARRLELRAASGDS